METQFVIALIIVILAILVILLIIKNRKDEKKFEDQLNQDYHKSKAHDVETEDDQSIWLLTKNLNQ